MIVDLTLHIDGLILENGKTVDDYVEEVEKITNNSYPIRVEIEYEEI